MAAKCVLETPFFEFLKLDVTHFGHSKPDDDSKIKNFVRSYASLQVVSHAQKVQNFKNVYELFELLNLYSKTIKFQLSLQRNKFNEFFGTNSV